MPPPQLYDLTELQRHANRLFGFTRAANVAGRAEALRGAEAPQLPAHRQPLALADDREHAPRRRPRDRGALPRAPRCRDRDPSARVAASSTTPASPITTRSSPPTGRRPTICPRTSGRSTTSSAGGCSKRGTAITSTPSPPWSTAVTGSDLVDRYVSSGTSVEERGMEGPRSEARTPERIEGAEDARSRRSLEASRRECLAA